jgi:hypothetical protein
MASPKAKKRLAWWVLILAIIGWPVSAFTFAASEPQSVLALSWIAIILTAVLIVMEA